MEYPPDVGPRGGLSGDQGRSPRTKEPGTGKQAGAAGVWEGAGTPWERSGPDTWPGPPASVWSLPSPLDRPKQGFSKRRPFTLAVCSSIF